MVQSQLSAYSGSDPIWGFVALVGSELFTGEAAVGLDPRVRLFAVNGHIYFAEREDDAPVANRLVNCGAITANQLARGVVQAGGNESLARLFQHDATIDRDAVELTVATATETLLAAIAHNPVGMPEVFPLRHHAAGLHHWLRGASPMETDFIEADLDEAVAAPETPASAVESYAAPQQLAEPAVLAEPTVPAVPEWPRVDDEPVWDVPSIASELPQISELVVLADVPIAAAPIVEQAAVPITAAQLPQLASLSSIQVQPAPAAGPTPNVEPVHAHQPAIPPELIPSLPKLASAPMSVKDLKEDLRRAAASTTEPFAPPSNKMAAVQIWEMVDDLFEEPKGVPVGVAGDLPPGYTGWRPKGA